MAKKTIEFTSLKEGIKARLAELSKPGVKQTDAVITARQKMEDMLAAYDGCCITMNTEIEYDE
jgi:hypothetical protein